MLRVGSVASGVLFDVMCVVCVVSATFVLCIFLCGVLCLLGLVLCVYFCLWCVF